MIILTSRAFCLLTVALAQPALRGSELALEQALVFDAGSSGTRIHIFNMRMPHGGAHVPRIDLSVRDNQTWKVKPGLSQFAQQDDLQGCRENIERLVGFAKSFVPVDRRKDTPVLLKATAGLRAVPEAKAAAVLQTVRSTLQESGFRFQDDWVDIIKGKEEAGLAWIAANYLHGTFDGLEEPLGIIEMGGGSTQVSFEIPKGEEDQAIPADAYTFQTALGKVYHLYAHSYLGFGQDYAQSKMIDASDGDDPCYPKGYSRVNRLGGNVKGVGNSQQCKSNLQKVLFQEEGAPGHYVHELPLPGGPFIATENFFYVRQDLKLDQMEGVCPSQAEADEICGKDLAATVEKACFSLSYQLAFLSAIKVLDQGVAVKVKRKINGGDIDWALGAALVHLLETRGELPESSWMTSPGLQLPMALTLLAAVAIAAAALWIVRRPVVSKMRMDPTLFGAKNGLE